ncbi:MAG TPA: FAD-dependent oxidoreductase [Methanoregulaceae archaeon]|nr:FAD-dependent oxidoreductase [Methanoregulaceae archaeon]
MSAVSRDTVPVPDTTVLHRYNCVIIGGGLTGLRAALEIYEKGFTSAIISKVHPLRSHSVAAQGGINAALGNADDAGEDTWQAHAYDTVKGSDYLADQDAVALMCREAPKTVFDLEHMGTVFSRRNDGKIAQRPFGGAGFPRTCYAADRTGHNLLHTLYEQLVSRQIPVYEEFFVTSLVTENDKCTGCTALELRTGRVHGFCADAVLMATGGFGRIYSRSTNALINTGDGTALAFRAGASLKDMEFVQFHPTSLAGTNILITEGARGEGGVLVNRLGERFMMRYAPSSLDLAPRDVVARAIQTEIIEGRGFPGDYVHLDLTSLGEDLIETRLPGIRQIAIDFAGIDPVKSPLPVQPAQHYSMGGIDVNNNGATCISGLYAAGECACISVHGANRLGGNSLLETVVFGKIVADTIIGDIREKSVGSIQAVETALFAINGEIEYLLNREAGENPGALGIELKEIMVSRFGIFRDQKTMAEGIEMLASIEDRSHNIVVRDKTRIFNQSIIQSFELQNMVLLATAIAKGAIERKESRGSHARTDYPLRDDARFMMHTIATLEQGSVSIRYEPVRAGMFEPGERVY